jgi:hypothetical protein
VINHLGPWEIIAQVEAATGEWASWYNTRRLMGPIGSRPPAEYEQAWRDGTLHWEQQEGGGHGRRSLPQGGLRPHPRGSAPGPGHPQRWPRQAGIGERAGRALPVGRPGTGAGGIPGPGQGRLRRRTR